MKRMHKADLYDSVVNKHPYHPEPTKLAVTSSVYLSKLQTSAAITENAWMGSWRSHVIEPKLLCADDFYNFLLARQKHYLNELS